MSDNKENSKAGRPKPRASGASSRVRSEDVAHAIGRRIVAGNPKPGAVLPTEHRLCEEIGVSRASLREGFRLLAARGMIVGRRKVGTMVRPVADWNMLDASVLSWHLEQEPSETFIDSLFEARSIIEPAAAAMAARRAGPDDIAAMTKAFRAMAQGQGLDPQASRERSDGEDIDGTVSADLRFHKAILAAARNHFFATFGALIGSSLIASFRLNWHAHKSASALSLAQHEDVLAAIAAADPDGAQAAMRALLVSAHQDARAALAWKNACA
jgi:GntR family transcriptional regulator, galactonate operon transcriptional repressor